MFQPNNNNPPTNILGMTKSEVIFTIFINRKDISLNDSIMEYNRMKDRGIIEETEYPNTVIRDMSTIIKDIPKEVLENMDKNIVPTKKETDGPCYVDRYRNFENDMVKNINDILGDRKEDQTPPSSLSPVTDEDFKKIVSKNTNIKL